MSAEPEQTEYRTLELNIDLFADFVHESKRVNIV